MEGKNKNKIIITNPGYMEGDDKAPKGKVISVPAGAQLDADLSAYEGFEAYNGGTGGSKYPQTELKGALGSDMGQSQNIAVSRLKGGDKEAIVISRAAAGLTEIEVPNTEAQNVDEGLHSTAVRDRTRDDESQHVVVGGLSGTDPSKGIPKQVVTEDVLIHPHGVSFNYGDSSSKPASETTFDELMKKVSKSQDVTDANVKSEGYDKKGVTNLTPESEGTYILQGWDIEFKKDSWDATAIGVHKIQQDLTAHKSYSVDDKRNRGHNRVIKEMEYINTTSSDDRSSKSPYCAFNTKSPRMKGNFFAYYFYRMWRMETGANIFASWESSILAHSYMRYRLNLDGQRENTWLEENFLNRSDAYLSDQEISPKECASVDDRFSAKKWAKGSVANWALMHESDKKFTDDHGKVPFLTQNKNHLAAFASGEATRFLSGFRMDPECLSAIKEARYYTYENTSASHRLFVTDGLSLSFGYDITNELIGPERRVDPEPVMSGSSYASYHYSSSNTYPFVSTSFVTGAHDTQRIIICNPLFAGIRAYLDSYAPSIYAKLSKAKGFTTGAESYHIFVPAVYTVTQPSAFGTLIAESIEYIANAKSSVDLDLGPYLYSDDDSGSHWPFERGDIEFVDLSSDTVKLKKLIHMYEALEAPSRHYSTSADTSKALYSGKVPGVFDSAGADFLHWFNRDVFSKVGSLTISNSNNLNSSTTLSIYEGPAYAGAVDYAASRDTWCKDNDLSESHPTVKYRFNVAQRGLSRVNVPYMSTLNCFNDMMDVSDITSRTFYRQNRIISPFTCPNPNSYDDLDIYYGIPFGEASNPSSTGRLHCAIPTKNNSGSAFDIPTGLFTLEWYLNQVRNNSMIVPLPKSYIFNQAKSGGNPIITFDKTSSNTTLEYHLPKYSDSILNEVGVTYYMWRKDVHPSEVDNLMTRFHPKSDLVYRVGHWDRFDMGPSAPAGVVGSIWNVPICVQSIQKHNTLYNIMTGFNAWASGDADFKSDFTSPYSGNTFHKSDSYRVLYKPADVYLQPKSNEGSTSFNMNSKSDFAAYVYGKIWLFRDPLCMFDRIRTGQESSGSTIIDNHDMWLEINGFGGWSSMDYTAAAEAFDDAKTDLNSRYLYRITESGVITELLIEDQKTEEVISADAEVAEIANDVSE